MPPDHPRRNRALRVVVLTAILVLGLVSLPWGAKWLALQAIEDYQSKISPYKGYRCAYAMLYRRPTCSAYGKAAIRKHGLLRGFVMLQKRFRECQEAGRALARVSHSDFHRALR